MNNYFKGTLDSPYHISIGALVVNKEGKVYCHYFGKTKHPYFNHWENFYLLMRETIEPNESIETCLARGLMEEFGMIATFKSYLGSIVAHFPLADQNKMIQKTTLYFLCDFISLDESKRKGDDVESVSKIMWLAPEDLIPLMKEQGIRFNPSLDESEIIERFLGTVS